MSTWPSTSSDRGVWPIATKARALGDWVASKDRNLTDIFITHGQGDHWFASGLLAERFVRAIQRDSM